MADINIVVANNIIDQMKKHNMKQIDLANAIGEGKGSGIIGIHPRSIACHAVN